MKIVAIHMKTILADVDLNMKYAKQKIVEAVSIGAELILFPEFFTTGFAFTTRILDSVLDYENPKIRLSEWAKEYQIIIGGSFLCYNDEDVFNTFHLIFPNGDIYTHSKDIPTLFEHFCSTFGDENQVFETPIGNIGVALCWEQIRWNTVKRMIGNVDLVLAGSCWWGFSEDDPAQIQELSNIHQDMAVNAPITLAKLLHVPVIHASHYATFNGLNFPTANKQQIRKVVGATQIIDEGGSVLSRKLYNEEPGIIIEDLNITVKSKKLEVIQTNDYWIPDMKKPFIDLWDSLNPVAEKYYKNVSKPYLKMR